MGIRTNFSRNYACVLVAALAVPTAAMAQADKFVPTIDDRDKVA